MLQLDALLLLASAAAAKPARPSASGPELPDVAALSLSAVRAAGPSAAAVAGAGAGAAAAAGDGTTLCRTVTEVAQSRLHVGTRVIAHFSRCTLGSI